jgi:hypothetical protein
MKIKKQDGFYYNVIIKEDDTKEYKTLIEIFNKREIADLEMDATDFLNDACERDLILEKNDSFLLSNENKNIFIKFLIIDTYLCRDYYFDPKTYKDDSEYFLVCSLKVIELERRA